MPQRVFHGILVDVSFIDRRYPLSFKIFAQKRSGDWDLIGIEVPREHIDSVVADIQAHMRTDEHFYNHLYDDEMVIVIFKQRIFYVKSHASSWTEVQKYSDALGIPNEQLDFWPNRFQDEIHYFGRQNL